MNKKIPAVSIIIPMYNTEKYIGECLDSIFAQTFEDYEVIVVDDCSTDNSCAIVENYIATHMGGGDKLRLIRSEKNSNTPGMPRNVGIRFSRGEYVMFVDSDDGLTPTALEELYPIAKNFDADVLYCEKYYPIKMGEKFITNKDFLQEAVIGNISYNFVNKPTLVSFDTAERIQDIFMHKLYVVPWNYLIRRDLISAHDIHFPNIKYGEDNFFVIFIVCWAKNLVRVPNIVYVKREREGAIGDRSTLFADVEIRRYADHVFQGVSIITKFAREFPFLKEHPEFRYAIFNFLDLTQFDCISPLYTQIPEWKLEPLIRRELDKIEDKTPLTSFLFSRMARLNLETNQQGAMIRQLKEIIQQLQSQLQQ